MYGRFAALPDQAEPLQRSQLMAAFSVGSEIIQLRRIAFRLELGYRTRRCTRSPRGRPKCDRGRAACLGRPGARRTSGREPGSSSSARPHPCNLRGAYPTCRLLRRRRARVRFTEINLFAVYVAPISVMMVAAWVVTIGLRRFAARFRLAALCLAPRRIRVCCLHDRALIDRPLSRALISPCPRSKPKRSAKRRKKVPQPSGRPSLLTATGPGGASASFRC